jgi:Acetoacetate decarboxylase (ADC)
MRAMAAFSIDCQKAGALLPGNELFPLKLLNKGVLLITVVNYLGTTIGNYIEYSIAIACTHGSDPAPPILPAILQGTYQTGQFVLDLPVSTEISVKGGKGIWGMPKHQANLSFEAHDDAIVAQYEADGMLGLALRVQGQEKMLVPLSLSISSYAQFRGMLFKSYLYFDGHAAITLQNKNAAQLVIGNHPLVQPLKQLGIDPHPLFTAYIPEARGILDDHFECWFISAAQPPAISEPGLESVVTLGLGHQWLAPPKIEVNFDS